MTGRIVPLGLLLVAGIYLWATLRIELDPWSADELVNARAMPLFCGILLALFATVMLFRGLTPTETGRRYKSLAMMAACIVGFAVLIPNAGLWPALALFLAASLKLLGERRPLVLTVAPLATALAGWTLIEVGLGVYIHPGAWWS
ncbi:MAG: tripartite tricarboxylate transporter TctB family protein [Gammaproteobacteria bacterium]|nr:tripartite tricarboxylate transporter TctB family protein [Gammaproteobacteria bacterium]